MKLKKILIVEDNVIDSLVVKHYLEGTDFAVISVVKSCEEALLDIRIHRPDLVLMDVSLDGKKDGIETVAEIYHLLHVPIIFVTSDRGKETMKRAELTFPFAYLIKPIQKEELIIAIKIALQKHQYIQKMQREIRRIKSSLTDFEAVIKSREKQSMVFSDSAINKLHDNPKAIKEVLEETMRLRTDLNDTQILYKIILDHSTSIEEDMNHQLETATRKSEIDPLTQIFNRNRFQQAVITEMKKAAILGKAVSLILFDIDNFKIINDTFGHLAGDKVLTTIAESVSESIRAIDLFARWGGEEFVILLPESNIGLAADIAERIRKAIEALIIPDVGNITCSFGVSQYLRNDTSESWLNRTDKALYEAKEAGKNCIKIMIK